MWLPKERLSVSRADKRQLRQMVRDPLTPKRVAMRAWIVLGASDGTSNTQLAQELAVSRPTVIHWRRRFQEAGVAGLLGDPLEARRKSPLAGRRTAGAEASRAAADARRQAPEKLLDIVGIYVNPPDKAVAFSVEERSPQEGDPPPNLAPAGKTAGKTKDYIRHGTTTLFAALGILVEKAAHTASVQQHTWLLEFLECVERNTPPGLQVHLIVGPQGTHEDAQMKRWFALHTRFHVHCTPKGGSWINLTKRWWFAEIKRERMQHRALGRVAELVRAVDGHLLGHGENPRPFVWTAALSQDTSTLTI